MQAHQCTLKAAQLQQPLLTALQVRFIGASKWGQKQHRLLASCTTHLNGKVPKADHLVQQNTLKEGALD